MTQDHPGDRPLLASPFDSLPVSVPFVGPEAIERDLDVTFAARIGANENGFGPAASVIETMRQHAGEMWMHGDPDVHDLRAALAGRLGIAMDEVLCAEGIDGVLALACRLHLNPERSVVCSKGAYPTFLFHVAGTGAKVAAVPYRERRNDLRALAETAKRERAAIVYLSNPDNPTGSHDDGEAISQFIEAVPGETLILLDEAYGEFAPDGASMPIDTERPNLIRLRTFSKAYGLAGMRVGYAIGHRDTLAPFELVRNHFGVTRMGQLAAMAALADESWVKTVLGKVEAAKSRLGEIAERNGLRPIPSATNFVSIECGSIAASKWLVEEMAKRKVFIRRPGVEELGDLIRVTSGPAADMDLFGKVLRELLAEYRRNNEA